MPKPGGVAWGGPHAVLLWAEEVVPGRASHHGPMGVQPMKSSGRRGEHLPRAEDCLGRGPCIWIGPKPASRHGLKGRSADEVAGSKGLQSRRGAGGHFWAEVAARRIEGVRA